MIITTTLISFTRDRSCAQSLVMDQHTPCRWTSLAAHLCTIRQEEHAETGAANIGDEDVRPRQPPHLDALLFVVARVKSDFHLWKRGAYSTQHVWRHEHPPLVASMLVQDDHTDGVTPALRKSWRDAEPAPGMVAHLREVSSCTRTALLCPEVVAGASQKSHFNANIARDLRLRICRSRCVFHICTRPQTVFAQHKMADGGRPPSGLKADQTGERIRIDDRPYAPGPSTLLAVRHSSSTSCHCRASCADTSELILDKTCVRLRVWGRGGVSLGHVTHANVSAPSPSIFGIATM